MPLTAFIPCSGVVDAREEESKDGSASSCFSTTDRAQRAGGEMYTNFVHFALLKKSVRTRGARTRLGIPRAHGFV